MRKIACLVAVLVTAAFSPAKAAGDELLDTVEKYYSAVLGTAQNQDAYCPKPRSNTTERCIEDFGRLYDMAAATLGYDLLYKRSLKAGDEGSTKYFYAALGRSFDGMQRLQKEVKDFYYPLPRISEAKK